MRNICAVCIMFTFKAILLGTVFVVLCSSLRSQYTYTYDQVKIVYASPEFFNISVFRIQKYNRTTYVLNWEFETFVDLDETVFGQLEAYVSRFNNNQFVQTPFRVPKMNACDYFKGPYRANMMEYIKNYSNFPQYAPDDPVCPFRKV